jgi:hypothetical protein
MLKSRLWREEADETDLTGCFSIAFPPCSTSSVRLDLTFHHTLAVVIYHPPGQARINTPSEPLIQAHLPRIFCMT